MVLDNQNFLGRFVNVIFKDSSIFTNWEQTVLFLSSLIETFTKCNRRYIIFMRHDFTSEFPETIVWPVRVCRWLFLKQTDSLVGVTGSKVATIPGDNNLFDWRYFLIVVALWCAWNWIWVLKLTFFWVHYLYFSRVVSYKNLMPIWSKFNGCEHLSIWLLARFLFLELGNVHKQWISFFLVVPQNKEPFSSCNRKYWFLRVNCDAHNSRWEHTSHDSVSLLSIWFDFLKQISL